MDTKIIIFSVLLVFDITSCDGCYVCKILDGIDQKISSLQRKIDFAFQPGVSPAYPADSCAAVLQANSSSPSGYYWIMSSKGSAVSMYCDMTRSCGNITGGWMRVAKLDMTVSSQCPSGLKLRTDPNKRTCVSSIAAASCSSVTYSTQNVRYSKVCGKIKAYQYASPDAFGDSHTQQQSIDTYYVDGISLTYGSPRQHIWTFGAALQDDTFCIDCKIDDQGRVSTPPFVGRDFFCDTGCQYKWQYVFYDVDPLWDGITWNKPCSPNNPPWFFKQLPQNTTDDVEMRLCRDGSSSNEDVAVEKVDIYVQ